MKQKRYDCALFEGVDETEYERLIAFLKPREETFRRGSVAYRYITEEKVVAILLEGVGRVVNIDDTGNEILLERLVKGSIFGNSVSYGEIGEDTVYVVADTDCKILFIKFSTFFAECDGDCVFRHKLLLNIIDVMRKKTAAIGERTEIMGNRTTRDKLICYFRHLCAKSGGNVARLEMNLTSLSEYICADRSAMMREIKKLKDEGSVSIDGKTVTLYI